jgi:hypothetical protein
LAADAIWSITAGMSVGETHLRRQSLDEVLALPIGEGSLVWIKPCTVATSDSSVSENWLDFVRVVVKFLPPEEEIRAQLRELTSQTRQLRADLQGLITRRGPSKSAFSHDHRYRLKPDPSMANDQPPPSTEEPKPVPPKRRSTKSTKKTPKRR